MRNSTFHSSTAFIFIPHPRDPWNTRQFLYVRWTLKYPHELVGAHLMRKSMHACWRSWQRRRNSGPLFCLSHDWCKTPPPRAVDTHLTPFNFKTFSICHATCCAAKKTDLKFEPWLCLLVDFQWFEILLWGGSEFRLVGWHIRHVGEWVVVIDSPSRVWGVKSWAKNECMRGDYHIQGFGCARFGVPLSVVVDSLFSVLGKQWVQMDAYLGKQGFGAPFSIVVASLFC